MIDCRDKVLGRAEAERAMADGFDLVVVQRQNVVLVLQHYDRLERDLA